MKKLLYKMLVFIALFIAIDYGIGQLFTALENKVIDYPINYGNTYLKAAHNLNEDIIIIGESRAHGNFIPSVLEDSLIMSVINAANNGSYMSQQAAVIRMMLNKYVPQLIIWEVNPTSLMETFQLDELDAVLDLTPFYKTDSLSRCLIQQRSSYECIKMQSNAYRNNNKLVGLLLIIAKGHHEDNLKGYNPLSTSGYIFPSKRELVFDDDFSKDRYDLLKGTLELLKIKKCRVLLVSSPQYENSNLNSTKQAKMFESLMDSLGVPYLDYRYDYRFQSDSTLFKDCSHLNEKGASAFMQIIIPEINTLIQDTI